MEKRCVHCGHPIKLLFHPSKLKLKKCKNCKQIADQYVEYHSNLLGLELLLLRKAAYRHILFNRDLPLAPGLLALAFFSMLVLFDSMLLG